MSGDKFVHILVAETFWILELVRLIHYHIIKVEPTEKAAVFALFFAKVREGGENNIKLFSGFLSRFCGQVLLPHFISEVLPLLHRAVVLDNL